MKITLMAYGVAKDILNSRRTELHIPEGQTINNLKQQLIEAHPRFSKLESLRFAIGEHYQSDDYLLKDGEELVIIPPVSGG